MQQTQRHFEPPSRSAAQRSAGEPRPWSNQSLSSSATGVCTDQRSDPSPRNVLQANRTTQQRRDAPPHRADTQLQHAQATQRHASATRALPPLDRLRHSLRRSARSVRRGPRLIRSAAHSSIVYSRMRPGSFAGMLRHDRRGSGHARDTATPDRSRNGLAVVDAITSLCCRSNHVAQQHIHTHCEAQCGHARLCRPQHGERRRMVP